MSGSAWTLEKNKSKSDISRIMHARYSSHGPFSFSQNRCLSESRLPLEKLQFRAPGRFLSQIGQLVAVGSESTFLQSKVTT